MDEKNRKSEALQHSLPGLEPASRISKLHTNYIRTTRIAFFFETKNITHFTRCMHARPNLDNNTPQTRPCTGKADLWRAGRFQRHMIHIIHVCMHRYHNTFEQTPPAFKKKIREQHKKASEKKRSSCRVSNSRIEAQSCTQAIRIGGLLFSLEKKCITLHTSRACVTHGTRHAKHPNANDNAPRTSSCTGNSETWQTVRYQQDTSMRERNTHI